MKRWEKFGGISLILLAVVWIAGCQDQQASQPAPPITIEFDPVPEMSKEGPFSPREVTDASDSIDLYLDLTKASLTDLIYENGANARAAQTKGNVWPSRAYTMIGVERLENIRDCVEDVLARGVPGDLIEAGAWRGGATIFMRAILKAHGDTDRTVWVADSFEGLPKPNVEMYPDDSDAQVSSLHLNTQLAVSLEEVQKNFARYDLLDDQVRFLKGWFSDTLPDAPIEQLAVLRIDADMYESTMDALVNLYPKLSPGGYIILDDYQNIGACRQAIHDYRKEHDIDEEMFAVDWNAAYWKKRE